MESLPYAVPEAPAEGGPGDPRTPRERPDQPSALGTVLEQDRGSLPFLLLHGESLVVCAAWTLGEAGVTSLDVTTGWASVRESGEPLVLHDALCPATPAWFLAACVEESVEHDAVVAGVRPVTDTVKEREPGPEDGLLGATVDREELVTVASPVVLPARVVAGLEELPSTDLAAVVEALRADHPVRLLQAPPEGRRVGDEDELEVLASLTSPEGSPLG